MENVTFTLVPVDEKIILNERELFMREHFSYFGMMSLVYGIIYTFCMYKNQFGSAFLLYTIATVTAFVFFFKKMKTEINKETKIYFIAIILCGLSTCITANAWIQFMNWCCVIGLLSLTIISQFYKEQKWNILNYLKNILKLFFSTIGYSFQSVKETKRNITKESLKEQKNLKLIIAGIMAALAVLIIVFPLLISSDRVMYSMFKEIIDVFDMDKIYTNIGSVINLCLTFFAGFTLLYAFFYASCHSEFVLEPERKAKYYSPVTGITFTGIIAFVYVFYSGIQISYLFLGKGLPEGITYSEYAHEGFWQLLFVAFINVCMVLICNYLFEDNKWIKGILTIISICTFIMIASAVRRMCLYVGVYHLTMLRVLVFWALAILAFIMSGVVVSIYKKEFFFVKYAIAVCISGYLVLSFAQPDYWIAKYNVKHMQVIDEFDLYDMMYYSSVDAAPVIAEIDRDKVTWNCLNGDEIYEYYRQILDENEDMTIRSLNYSKIRAGKLAEEYMREYKHYIK